MKSVFAVLAAFVVASVSAGSILSEDQYQFLFTKWVQQHGRSYETTNDLFTKFSTFKANVDLVIAHNAKSDETYKMAVNKFADMTSDEFESMMGLKTNKVQLSKKNNKKVAHPKAAPCTNNSTTTANKNIDWTKGFLPAVRDQGQCGSCWSFSATGAIAGGYAAANEGKQLPTLSEQQFVDCVNSDYDSSFISEGCDGGLMSEAMQYASVEGQCADADYKYTARTQVCKAKDCKSQVKVAGYEEVHGDDEFQTQIYNAPFSVGIAASSSAFQFYSSGVVTKCTDRSLNHGVVLAGYFPEEQQPYYYVRNSWGSNWGDAGYIRLSSTGNQCGLATSPWDVIAKF